MKEFQTAAGYTSASLSNMGNMESSWLNRGLFEVLYEMKMYSKI
jgi:hypothetical protein